jgi:hypothetical protein
MMWSLILYRKLGRKKRGSYGAFTLDVKSMLNENLGGILGGILGGTDY